MRAMATSNSATQFQGYRGIMNTAAACKPLRILMIEDSEDDQELILRNIRKEGYHPLCERVETEQGLRNALNDDWDVILSDQHIPGFDGISALRIVREKDPHIPFLLISGQITEQLAISALKQGANDYLFKDNLMRLVPAMTREIEDFKTRKKKIEAEQKVWVNEQKLRQAHQLARSGHWEFNFVTKMFHFSDELMEILNIEVSKMSIRNFLKRIHPDDVSGFLSHFKNITEPNRTIDFNLRIFNKGVLQHLLCRCVIGFDNNKPRDIQGIFQDITDQVLSREVTEKALERNKHILSEMHHRVKNNLATISSLLELEKLSAINPDTKEVLSRNTYFIYNMALIQEMIYKSPDFSRIQFDVYLRELIELIRNNHPTNKRIFINTLLEPVELDIGKALPTALIVNELITNAYKHAFVDRTDGEINIHLSVSSDNRINIRISDNGIGFGNGFDYKKGTTPGYTLIDILTKQLSGTLTIRSEECTSVQLYFYNISSSQQKKYLQ